MKFSTIITIIASVAVGSANAKVNTSFLRSSINEDPVTVPESQAECYKKCATVEGRVKKAKDAKKSKITESAAACAVEHCGGLTRSTQETECVGACYKKFGKDVQKTVEKAIDDCEDKCEKSCSSSDKDDEDKSRDDCDKKCKKECESGSLDNKTVKKADKNLDKNYATVDSCIDYCVPEEEAPPAAEGSPADYETLKIA